MQPRSHIENELGMQMCSAFVVITLWLTTAYDIVNSMHVSCAHLCNMHCNVFVAKPHLLQNTPPATAMVHAPPPPAAWLTPTKDGVPGAAKKILHFSCPGFFGKEITWHLLLSSHTMHWATALWQTALRLSI